MQRCRLHSQALLRRGGRMSSFLQRLAKNCYVPVGGPHGGDFPNRVVEIVSVCMRCFAFVGGAHEAWYHLGSNSLTCNGLIYVKVYRTCLKCGKIAHYKKDKHVRLAARYGGTTDGYKCYAHFNGVGGCNDSGLFRKWAEIEE